MERVVFVAEHRDDGSPLDGFTGAHAWALATRGIRPAVIVDEGTARSRLVPARVVELPRPAVEGDGWRTVALLDALSGLVAEADRWVVVARGGPAWIEQVTPEIRGLGAHLLWWQTEGRTQRLPHPDATPVDGILTVLATAGPWGHGAVPTYMVGAGIDLRSVAASTTLPPSLPLRVLCSSPHPTPDDVGVVVRAVAIARAQGLDARLTIVRDDDSGGPIASAELEQLVDHLGIEDAVTYADGPVSAGRLHRSHAMVDWSGARIDRAVLVALASGQPVVSCSRLTAKLVARTPALLQFEPEDEAQLAQRIVTLSHLSNRQRVALGTALRAAVETRHSVDAWADRLVAVVKEQAPPAFAPIPAVAVAVAPAPGRHRVRLGTGVAAACLALAATAWSIGAVSTGGDGGHRSASAQPTAQTSSDPSAASPSPSRPDGRAGSATSSSGPSASSTQSGSRNGSRPGTDASAKAAASGTAAVLSATKFGAAAGGGMSQTSTSTSSGTRSTTSSTPPTTASSRTTPATTAPPLSSPPATAPPATTPPATSPPATDPPATDPPTTTPPATAPPATDPPTTVPPTTDPPVLPLPLPLPPLGDLIDLPFL